MTRTQAVALKQHEAQENRRRRSSAQVLQHWTLLFLAFFGLTGVPAHAQDSNGVSSAAVARAQQFMAVQSRGQEVFGLLHFGTGYRGCSYVQGIALAGGAFKLEYSYAWDTSDNDHTELWFVFTPAGDFDHLQVADSTAVINQPFAYANVSIAILGNVLLTKYNDRLSEQDRQLLTRLVNTADARRLLEWELRVDQALGS